jgi:hypothetical protein
LVVRSLWRERFRLMQGEAHYDRCPTICMSELGHVVFRFYTGTF